MRRLVPFVVLVLAVGFSASASAKDLTGRVGVGYVSTLPSTGALSARYWVTDSIGIEGDLGFSLFNPKQGDAQNAYALQLGGMYNFVDEPNLHVYGNGNLVFGSTPVQGVNAAGNPTVTNKTTVGANAGIGMEFFFVGLPNLGWTAGVGINVLNTQDVGTTVQLGGSDFASLGIRYYFGGPKGPPK